MKSNDLSIANVVTLLHHNYFISEGKLEATTAIKAVVSALSSRVTLTGISTMTLHCLQLFLFLLLGSWWPDSVQHVAGAVKVREHYIAAQITSWTYKPQPEEKSR